MSFGNEWVILEMLKTLQQEMNFTVYFPMIFDYVTNFIKKKYQASPSSIFPINFHKKPIKLFDLFQYQFCNYFNIHHFN